MSAAAHKIAKMENEKLKPQDASDIEHETASTSESNRAENFSGELKEPRWSVITFESCAARNLPYDEAAQKLQELQKENAVGLCIITDEAAARMKSKKQ